MLARAAVVACCSPALTMNRYDPGEEIDQHATRAGGDQPDGDRAEDPNAVIERIMRLLRRGQCV